MPETLLPLTSLDVQGQRTYQQYLEVGSDSFLLVITPIHRMGCHSLTDEAGIAIVEMFKKNARYPKGYEFSDIFHTQPIAGKDLTGSVIKEINKALRLCGFLDTQPDITSLSFFESGTQQTISMS